MSGSDKSLTSPQLIFQVSPSTPSLRRLLSPARLHSSVHGHQLSTIGNETESSIRCPKGIGGDFYTQAYDKYRRSKYRRNLHLARAIRESHYFQYQLALKRVKEAEIVLSILKAEARKAELMVGESDLKVGKARADLHSNQILENDSDEEEYFRDDGVVEGALTDSEADNEVDEEQEASYFNMVYEQPQPALTQSALKFLDDSFEPACTTKA